MLIARDGGCTKPCCTVGAYGSQVHHARRDWIDGGNTNVDDLGLACGVDNRMVGPDAWTTTVNDQHEVEWIRPPHLDTGQARVNFYHRPEKLLRPPEDPQPPPTDPEPRPDNTIGDPTPLEDPWAEDRPGHPGKPGGPAPPPPPPPLEDPWG
jgi:hypothetical protein